MRASPIHDAIRKVGWSTIGLLVLLSSVAPAWFGRPALQWLPWVIGLLVVGIPHGALDHRVGAMHGVDPTRRRMARFYIAYLSIIALVVLAWALWPPGVIVGFLIVAGFHFGQGDVDWSRRFGLIARGASWGYALVFWLARSVLPILWPPLAHPNVFASAIASAVNIVDPASEGGRHLTGPLLWWSGVAVVAIVSVQLFWAASLGLRATDSAHRRTAAEEILETLLLVLLFSCLPPVAAVGVYFNIWHALRHIARLLLAEPSTRRLLDAGRFGPALLEFHRQALPMTLGATGLMILLAWSFATGLGSLTDLGRLVILMLSALTLPHVLVVVWMDLQATAPTARPREIPR